MENSPSPKRELDDLAVLGGAPLFAQPLHVGRPNVGNRERFRERLDEMFERSWLTNNGPLVAELEGRIAKFVGVKHCICMCNGTVALEIASRAVGMRDEVIVPSFSFIATAHALEWQGITPVFCDVDPHTHVLDIEEVEKHITPRTSGILAVHTWGRACDIESLSTLAARHRLKLVFDAAHAFGCSHRGRMIGGFGDCEAFSFHATKFFNTFEGGAVTTNNDELAATIRLMKNFGFAGKDNVICLGTNGKMSEASAAMGLTNLESLDQFSDLNARNYVRYRSHLSGLQGLRFYSYPENERNTHHYVIAEIEPKESSLTRDLLIQVLHAENIFARRYFYPGCHRMEPYRARFPRPSPLLRHSERLTERVISLPTGIAVRDEDVDSVCELIRFAIKRGEEITRRLSSADLLEPHAGVTKLAPRQALA